MTRSQRQNFFLKKRAQPISIAHRGANDHAPENTLEGFHQAVKLKADAIELDVQLTSDNEVVVFHDPKLNRMTNGSGLVISHKYSELQDLKIDSGTNWESSNQTIPLLYDVLDEFGRTIPFQIELKTFYGIRSARRRHALVEAIAQIIRRLGLRNHVMLKSFDPFTLLEIKKIDQSLVCGYLMIPGLSGLRHFGVTRKAFEACEVIEPHSNLQAEFVKKLHFMGKTVITWIVDDPEQARKLAESGVDGWITNHLNLMP